jgi:metal-dependent amidase/aminoacylase/carboxypeptidase family protein
MFKVIAVGGLCLMSFGAAVHAADAGSMKKRAVAGVQARAKLAQQINDSVFSFAELGYQEVETSRYLTGILEQNGFKSSGASRASRPLGLRAGRTGRAVR